MEHFSLLQGIWRVGNHYWRSKAKNYAILLLMVIIGLNITSVYIQVWLNQWRNVFFNTLQDRDMTAFLDSLYLWGGLILAAWAVSVYQNYLRQLLAVSWRSWLTDRLLGEYLQSKKYYCLQLQDNGIDNPDQMICEDVKLFIDSLLKVFLWFLYNLGILCSFTLILWELSGSFSLSWRESSITIHGDMVWIAVAYALMVDFVMGKMGHPLVQLNFLQQRYEANFRFALVRLREYAEEIALYSGENRERHLLSNYFKKVYDNLQRSIKRQKILDSLIFFLCRGTEPLPYIVAVPRFFSGELQLGGLMQVTGAFEKVQRSLLFFSSWYKEITELKAIVKRLVILMDTMEEFKRLGQKQSIKIIEAPEAAFSVENLNLKLPNGELLLDNFAMRLQPGESLLITGSSGCGKSTLIKAIAGIWPFGEGHIYIPQNQQCLFLPQSPYLPVGTLREALLYPRSSQEYSEESIQGILKKCCLEHLLERLDDQENWSHVLSLGEQQRIAFARAILQRPQWLFLDEATSGLDEATEKKLYSLIRSELKGTGVMSVGHRKDLFVYHQKILTMKGKGCWDLVA
ncbi:ABC transporter ATP-binding protein/permease [Pelosinus propionicus]|uniref:Putative ATP-binding cassette transporter n=1 Tax=Pelosinus propionicus DSM 13327 TaxID=1123291 RepID=A0A1I4PYA1_9FIRM|nr:ABC transporter ATP-binding protein/permease [Pelosinus propionicus]SFM32797.1 putative ATP-binding cassette transporter [Pelosinus propionicus DSM 13327]